MLHTSAPSIIANNLATLVDVLRSAKNGICADEAADALGGCSADYATAMLANLRATKRACIKSGRWYLVRGANEVIKPEGILVIPGAKEMIDYRPERLLVHFGDSTEKERAGVITETIVGICAPARRSQKNGSAIRVTFDVSLVTCRDCQRIARTDTRA